MARALSHNAFRPTARHLHKGGTKALLVGRLALRDQAGLDKSFDQVKWHKSGSPQLAYLLPITVGALVLALALGAGAGRLLSH